MAYGLLRAVFSVLAVVALSACAVTEQNRQRERELLTRRIVDDAMAYNEAYNAALAGQMLMNILRAYNRQPRQYTSMSGFTNNEPDERQTTIGISDLPLGDLGQEWGAGGIELQNTTQLEPQYSVSPFDARAFSALVLQPTSTTVLRQYWDTGWNRDLLLLLIVDRMDVRTSPRAPVRRLFNSASTIANDCEGEGYGVGGCAFVRVARELARATRGDLRVQIPNPTGGACYPFAAYDVRAVEPLIRAPRRGQPAPDCPVTIVVGQAHYTLYLRSLDGMVYYVGELLRRDAAHPPAEGVLEARVGIAAPGSATLTSPLFRVVAATAETARDYAATVTFSGRRYSAGAPASNFCFHPAGAQYCTDPAADRSGTVLELLMGILAHNQSEAVVRAPQNTVVRE